MPANNQDGWTALLAERDELRAERQRLHDLVRYKRMELHADDLISDEEYAELLSDHGSVARLAGYDKIRARMKAAEAEAARLTVERSLIQRAICKTACGGDGSEDDDVHYTTEEIVSHIDRMDQERKEFLTRAIAAEAEVARLRAAEHGLIDIAREAEAEAEDIALSKDKERLDHLDNISAAERASGVWTIKLQGAAYVDVRTLIDMSRAALAATDAPEEPK